MGRRNTNPNEAPPCGTCGGRLCSDVVYTVNIVNSYRKNPRGWPADEFLFFPAVYFEFSFRKLILLFKAARRLASVRHLLR